MPRVILIAAVLLATASPASAWRVGTQLDVVGCHEPITAQALRNVRARFATAPAIAPSRDERALFADVQFSPPDDMIDDVAGMALLLGVRDNDLKGQNPLASLDLVQVHGNPETQHEHCIRAADQDGDAGEVAALAACNDFIVAHATAALAGLGADGTVDGNARMPLAVYASIAGHVDPMLPVFYVEIGQAMHALEDSFTHTYRTGDGEHVTTVLNWIELVAGTLDEGRDGPPHRLELDNCHADDPIIERNYALSVQAATELLQTALDPQLSRDDKIAGFQAITARYLAFEPGCEASNNWCDAPEADVSAPTGGCSATAGAGPGAVLAIGIALALITRRRRRGVGAVVPIVVGLLVVPRLVLADPQAEQPAVPPTPTEPSDIQDAAEGKEPGRDVKTPTVEQVREIRKDKRLGPALGFAVNLGGSFARGAAVGSVGLRYRLGEKWIVGLSGAWNPWITTAPVEVKAGVVEVYASGIRRFPMRYDRVNLRTSLHVGTSTLLFDVYGAPRHSTGLFIAGSVLGLDYDLGNSLRLVIDPAEMAVAIPSLRGIPLWYEQFRFMIGLQYGS